MSSKGNQEYRSFKELVLSSYFDGERDGRRFTSQDICDNLRETVTLTPDEVTEYMWRRGYILRRVDDRMVWDVK